jgi:hypothetical protein
MHERRAENRDNGPIYGVEYQLYSDDQFLYGHRFPSRDLGLFIVYQEKKRYQRDGWS